MTESEESQTFQFQAEINQLMSLIINTFYSDKSIFLRELISNASDSLDKIRHESLTMGNSHLSDQEKLHIEIYPDKDAKTLTIIDTGIGMTRQGLIDNLGTIARSGTKEFMEKLKEGADLKLIGQFGCGFYSSFLVSNSVTVISKHNDDVAHAWNSNAGGSFTITKINNEECKRGTRIILHLKDDQLQYLEENQIKQLVKRHSEYTGYDISLFVTKTTEKDVTDDEEDEDKKEEDEDKKEEDEDKKESKDDDTPEDNIADQTPDDPIVEEVKEEETAKTPEKKTKKVTETKTEMELLNKIRPLWTKNPKEVTVEEYQAFYKNISGDWEDSLAVKHFGIEGQLEFKCILYVPKRAPFDLFETTGKKRNNIKLYVKSVFVTDEVDDLIPEWLRFVKGVVDSQDLPLNISRENLQQNSIMRIMRKNIIKRALDLFKGIAEDEDKEKFKTFYGQFSKSIKLGIHEDSANRAALSALLRYHSTKSNGELTSLHDYITRMKEEQKGIYYITGDSTISQSPFLEQFRKRDIEVLYLNEPMDEYCVQQLRDFEDKKLICITKGDIIFDEDEEQIKKTKEEFERLCDLIKLHLGDKVERVVVSNRLVDTPCVLSTSEHGWSSHMEKIMKLQALRDNNMNQYMMAKKTFEINPDHKIIKNLKQKIDKENDDRVIKDLIDLLYQTSLISSGFDIENPVVFVKRIHSIVECGLNLEDEGEKPEEQEEQEEQEKPEEQDDSKMEEVD